MITVERQGGVKGGGERGWHKTKMYVFINKISPIFWGDLPNV